MVYIILSPVPSTNGKRSYNSNVIPHNFSFLWNSCLNDKPIECMWNVNSRPMDYTGFKDNRLTDYMCIITNRPTDYIWIKYSSILHLNKSGA